jgi:Cys-tRNA(Pro)/Cys-tRNA(Cys) deacylase
MKKTNAARILDQHKIDYELFEYEVDENNLGAEVVAAKIKQPIEKVFKTLILTGDKTGVIVAIIPGSLEVDLKNLASLSGNKKCMMVPMKEVLGLTGYIRGGVSPLGMKKNYPTFIDTSCFLYEKVFVSAGIRGLQLFINPTDLIKITNAKSGEISTF